MYLLPTIKHANKMTTNICMKRKSQQGQIHETPITTRSSCPPKTGSLAQLAVVYVLYKLSKTNSVLRLYGLVMTANFISPDIVSEQMYRCSFISTPL